MSLSTKKFKIFINGVSSPELLLWEPIFKNFLTFNKEYLCSFECPLSGSDYAYVRDNLGFSHSDVINTIEEITNEELIIFFCLAHQIPTSFTANEKQKACCFFGGLSSSNLFKQLKSARARGLTSLFSDLLPCEIKESVPLEEFMFFRDVQVFLPHGYDETTIKTNSNLKSKTLYVRDEVAVSSSNAFVEKTLFSALSQKEEFEVLDLSNTDISKWITRVLPGKNYEKIIIGDISIPLQHLLLDICKLKSIELQYFFTQSFPSPHRRYLNDNPLFESILATVTNNSSLRQKVFDILNFSTSSSTVKQEENHETMLKYSSPAMTIEDGLTCPRKLFDDETGKLESFRLTEDAACKINYNWCERSLYLEHPYVELDIGNDRNSRLIHTLVFLETLIQNGSHETSYALSLNVMHRLLSHHFLSTKGSQFLILPSLFRLDPIKFIDAIISIYRDTKDEKLQLNIINSLIKTLAILDIDYDLKFELYEKLRNSSISILLDLFIHLDLNENKEFMSSAKKAKLGINVLYPIAHYIETKPREKSLNAIEIEQIFESELQNAECTLFLVTATIIQQLVYKETTSLEYFDRFDYRFNYLFEKCAKSLFIYAYFSSINGNTLDKNILKKFNTANAPHDKILIICSSILLGDDKIITVQLDTLNEESVKDFLASDIDIGIKLQCLILIRHYFGLDASNDSSIVFYKSYKFRHHKIFLKLVEDLPQYQMKIEAKAESILRRISNTCIKFFR